MSQQRYPRANSVILFTTTNGINNNNNNHNRWLISAIRGGEISLPGDNDDEEEDEMEDLLSSVRNAFRSLVKFGNETIPPVSKIMRSFLHVVEKLIGVKLVPSKIIEIKTPKNSNMKKSKQKPTSKGNQKRKSSSNSNATNQKKEDKKKSAGVTTTTTTRTTALKDPSAATQKHATSKLKSTNPHYRIQKELKKFLQDPPPNLSVQVGTNIRLWVVTMIGANNTIYEGEVFKLRISFPKDYPTVPPSVYFLKGYIPKHEHVYTNGDICLSLLGKDWRPTMTAQSLAVSILSILSSAQQKSLPMDNAVHAHAKPGAYQKDWVYHDDRC
jgi:ubiquitin-conjugating enzyme E2 W